MNTSIDTISNNHISNNHIANNHSLNKESSVLGPSVYSDNQSLNGIREQAQTDPQSAIKAAAKEFEAFFMNEMLKSMRQASEVMGEDSMFSSSEEKMFVGMLDEQMSVDLSQQGSLGIAKMMLRDLAPELQQTEETFIKQEAFLSKDKPVKIDRYFDDVSVNKIAIENVSSLKNKNKGGLIDSSFNLVKKVEIEELKEVTVSSKIAPSKKSLFNSAEEFVKKLMPIAEKVASKIGLDPKILLAQAALETGWGQHIIHDETGKPSFNLFGIKNQSNWQGESVNINTLEVESGEFVKKNESFRVYDSFEKSFDDLVNFISESPRYKKAMDNVNDAKQFIRSVQEAGYATDPNYANKIINIFERDTLRVNSNVE